MRLHSLCTKQLMWDWTKCGSTVYALINWCKTEQNVAPVYALNHTSGTHHEHVRCHDVVVDNSNTDNIFPAHKTGITLIFSNYWSIRILLETSGKKWWRLSPISIYWLWLITLVWCACESGLWDFSAIEAITTTIQPIMKAAQNEHFHD